MHWGSQDNSVPGHQQQFHGGGGYGMPPQQGQQQQQQSNEGIPFDSNNFPALSGQTISSNSGAPNRIHMSGGTIGQPFGGGVAGNNRFPQMSHQPQQQHHFGGEFVAQKEDFPALSATIAQGGGKASGQGQQSQQQDATSSLQNSSSSSGGNGGGLGSVDMTPPLPPAPGQGQGVAQQQQQQQAPAFDEVSKDVRFGLLGLLEAIRMTDKDLNTLALGSDLTTFGLNLNAAECLFTQFCSPNAEPPTSSSAAGTSVTQQSADGSTATPGAGGAGSSTGSSQQTPPPFPVPPSYFTPPPSLKLEQFAKMQLETLFYMFYVLPRDMMQALAAQELYRREWKYHTDLRVWVKARSLQEQQQIHPGVQWIYFDLGSWDIKPFQFPSPGGSQQQQAQKSPIPGGAGGSAGSVLDEADVRVAVQNKAGAGAGGGLPPSNSGAGNGIISGNKQ